MYVDYEMTGSILVYLSYILPCLEWRLSEIEIPEESEIGLDHILCQELMPANLNQA